MAVLGQSHDTFTDVTKLAESFGRVDVIIINLSLDLSQPIIIVAPYTEVKEKQIR